MKKNIKEIVAENKSRQQKAREINARAGKSIFEVLSQSALSEWLLERLGGAKRLADIADPEALLLPELDKNLIEKVFRDNPDEIELLGRKVKVEYRGNSEPLIHLNFHGDEAKNWLKIPVEGIFLPGGREVCLYSSIELDDRNITLQFSSSSFSRKVLERLNGRVWEDFSYSSTKPMLPVPETVGLETQIPEVCEHLYGKCVGTGEDLLAFGVVVYTPKSWYSAEKFETSWFRTREEANASRTKSCECLQSRQEQISKEESEKMKALEMESLRLKEKEQEELLRQKRQEELRLLEIERAEKLEIERRRQREIWRQQEEEARKREEKDEKAGMTSLGDAFSRFGL